MKKISFLAALAVLSLGFLTSCEKGGKATDDSVIKYLPGTWKVTQEVYDDGEKVDLRDEILFTFGKEGEDVPEFGGSNSSIAGKLSVKYNGQVVVSRGRWNIEYDAEDPGVFMYLKDDNGHLISFGGNGSEYFYITSISGSSMTILDADAEEGSQEGFILKKQ